MPTYTGITIGPIQRTLDAARSTRELWAASYFFSYFMRRLGESLRTLEGVEQILPLEATPTEKTGAGLFPDRLILKHEGGARPDPAVVVQKAEHLVQDIAKKIHSHLKGQLKPNAPSLSEVAHYLKRFLQLNAQEVTLNAGENILFTLNKQLDAAELAPQLPDIIPEANHLARFFDLVNGSFLIEDAFGARKKRFDSLIQISARELRDSDAQAFDKLIKHHFHAVNIGNTDEESVLIKTLTTASPFGSLFRHLHKHIAVVHADGDHVGKALEQIGGEPAKVKDFSRFMHKFASGAVSDIVQYGAVPVYAGGDDLLFFAPLRKLSPEKSDFNHVWDLIHKIDTRFVLEFEQFAREQGLGASLSPSPTMSFGVCVAHYKMPLYESIRHSRNALWEGAKKMPKRHALQVRFLTHSGNAMQFIMPLSDSPPVWESFRTTLNAYLMAYQGAGQQPFGNTLARRLTALQPLFRFMRAQKQWSLANAVRQFIDDEAPHTQNQAQAFTDFMNVLYSEQTAKEFPGLAPQLILTGLVRLIHFYNRPNSDTDA